MDITNLGTREELEQRFAEEMITIGTSPIDAKTGQMFRFDAERLSKIAVETLRVEARYCPYCGLEVNIDMREHLENYCPKTV